MSTTPSLSVIVPTHNPHRERLARTLAGLRAQTLLPTEWELILVDNASSPAVDAALLDPARRPELRLVAEPEPGLSRARRCGFAAARGEFAVLVDDDNVLAPDYLAQVLTIFSTHPKLGVAGGKSLPEFAGEPPTWTREFFPLLALRDAGEQELIAGWEPSARPARPEYPWFAPIGAGMALRREAWSSWLKNSRGTLSDRKGNTLTSGGDNDIVLCALRAGWEVGYFPTLRLTHLIPSSRLDPVYLARLNRGIQKSWMQVLALHQINPWTPLTATGARLRQLKAWFAHRAWSSSAARVRWQGACGHFEGRLGS